MRLGAARFVETLFVEKNQGRAQQHGTRCATSKTEHVLLCRLSADQLSLYKSILESDDVRIALERRGERHHHGGSPAFRAIAALRAVCNHPDIYGGAVEGSSSGSIDRSAKLRALDAVLQRWKAQKHRALVFSQSVKMLDILEALAQQRGYAYARMDGSTPPTQRQATADAFNLPTSKTFCMLLTTRTGGVGLNLIGADRVALYDPDWNPQTDAQARERGAGASGRRNLSPSIDLSVQERSRKKFTTARSSSRLLLTEC